LSGEMMVAARPFIEKNIHPTVICSAYYKALDEGIKILEKSAIKIDFYNDEDVKGAL
jgi:T-complex protein 1 subunit gamma